MDIKMTTPQEKMDGVDRTDRHLRVKDVMSSSPVCVTSSADLVSAAVLMHDAGASSLPVIDELGRCVGIITATDFVSRFADYARHTRPLEGRDVRIAKAAAHDSLLLEVIPEDSVRCRMSAAVQTIGPDAPIRSAMRMMFSMRLHHIVVVDESSRPIGVVSSLDLLRALSSGELTVCNEERIER